jgi:endo-1,4-beta-mannosidase
MKRSLSGWLALGLALICAGETPVVASAQISKKTPMKKSAQTSLISTAALQVRGIELLQGGKPVVVRAAEFSGLRDLAPGEAKVFLKSAKAAGAQVVVTRAFTFSSGATTGLLGTEGKINDAEWVSLDDLLVSAREEGLGLLLTLTSGTEQDRWASWAGSANAGVFFRDFNVQKWFRDAAKALVTRVNPKTHKVYGFDTTIWGWVLCDNPVNTGGSPSDFNHWVVETVAFIRGLAPHQSVVLGLNPTAIEGIDPVSAAGAAGVDFILLHVPKGSNGKTVADWALQVGRPVLVMFESAPQGELGSSVSGLVVGADGVQAAEREGYLRQSFAPVVNTSTAFSDLFKKVEVVPGPAPYLKDGATAKIFVTLTGNAKLALRWGQDGDMSGRLEGTEAFQYEFQLGSLTAARDLSIQVEARKADGTMVLSDRKSVHLPSVTSLKLNPAPESKNFITVKDGKFYDGNKPWRYVGTNNYYLNHIDVAKRDSIFADARALGMKVMRVWAFGEAPLNHELTQDWEKTRYFTIAPGKYNEENLKHLDALVASAGQHGIRLIVALANNWADYGGAPQWAAYFGYKDKDDFFDKPEVQKAFHDYVRMLATRVNTVTGVVYKDDPTIFAWDLMNEPEYKRDETGVILAKWVDETSSFLKKDLGVKQLVTTGLEGFRATNGKHYSGEDFVGSQQSKTIDFATYHIYPASEYTRWNLDTTKAVITRYVNDAHTLLHKPVVMEEFGLPMTDPKYDKPIWLRALMKTFFDAGGDGVNYWMIVDPEYRYGDGNEFNRNMTEMANTFSVTAQELEASK